MNLNDYQKAAMKTARYPNIGSNLNYPILGLCGELGEVLHEHVYESSVYKLKDECGDVLWYIAAIAKELGLKMNEVLHSIDIYADTLIGAQKACVDGYEDLDLKHDIEMAVSMGTQIANVWKKAQRDDEGVLTVARSEAIKLYLARCFAALLVYTNRIGLAAEAVAVYNIDKLS